MFHRIKIKPHERALLFRENEPVALLRPGVHWYLDPLLKLRVEIEKPREPWLLHSALDLIVKSGILAGEAMVLDLKDYERALVWIDGRVSSVLDRGLYALWTSEREIRVEIVDARAMQLVRADLPVIVKGHNAAALLEVLHVEPGHTACGSVTVCTRPRSARGCTHSGRASVS